MDRAHDVLSDDASDTNDPLLDANMDQDDDDDDDDEIDDDEQSKHPRLMRACDHCRRKKVKCNGTRPACSHCLRMRLDCHYSPLVRKKRARRTIIDKLQERLLSMEQLLQPLVERLSPNDPVVCLGPGGYGQGFGFAPAALPTIAHPLGFLPPPPPSAYMALPATGVPHELLRLSPAPPGAAATDTPLPPAAIVEELVEIAMLRLTPGAPPVSWSRLLRRLRRGKLPEYIIYAAVAFAARFSSRPEFACTPRYNAGREYAKRAAELISGLVDKPDPDVVFGLILLSMYEWGCGRGDSAWTYVGMSARLAQRCRLHLIDEEEFTENVDGDSRSWARAEWRRRMWWHVYCGDRVSVIVASRPATMDDEDCVVDVPSHDHEWLTGTLPDGSDGASPPPQLAVVQKQPDRWWLIVELYRICGRVAEFANRRRRPVRSGGIPRRQMFDILCHDLESVRGKFPAFMEQPPPNSSLAPAADGASTMHNPSALYFTAHLVYHAARIILYRSELPEYQHEEVTPDHVERAKDVCVEAAHTQADVIRWALDSLPVEDWDPMVGVWSLQGASVHVNSALSADLALAEQSRQDLEVHLKLHVSADQYYHFNMAIVTMLHHVFDLRRRERLALDSEEAPDDAAAAALAQDHQQLAVHHRSDPDPWIVPRCSSFLGFIYSHQVLRRSLNNAIKTTTYNPPEIADDEDSSSPSAGITQPPDEQLTSYWGAAPAASTVPLQAGSVPAVAPGISFDLSGGLRVLPGPLVPQDAAHTDARGHFGQTSTGASMNNIAAAADDSRPLAKRPFGSSAGPGSRRGGGGGGGGKGTAEPTAEQQAQLQRLEDLRARVLLLKQLNGKQPGAPGLDAAGMPYAADGGVPKDMDGFLTNFAESIGTMATQLGSSDVPPASAAGSAPVSGGAAQLQFQQGAWAAAAGGLPQGAMASGEEMQRIIAQLQLTGPGVDSASGQHPAPFSQQPMYAPTTEDMLRIMNGMPATPRQDQQR